MDKSWKIHSTGGERNIPNTDSTLSSSLYLFNFKSKCPVDIYKGEVNERRDVEIPLQSPYLGQIRRITEGKEIKIKK